MYSIIIPAHNESTVIARCLESLPLKTSQVIVVANGCSDSTAEIAKRFQGVQVIETQIASKWNSLNLGDAAAVNFPRFYIDADIVIDEQSIESVSSILKSPDILAAAPRMNVDISNRSWAVRAFYHIWLNLPYCGQGMIGSGFYAVSEEGRKRWQEFPDIIADDGFVRLQFTIDERRTDNTCCFTITPPKSLSSLIAIKTRAHYGEEELRRKYPELWVNEDANHKSALIHLAKNPSNWCSIGVYIYVRIMTRWRVYNRLKNSSLANKWDRDDSSREPAVKD